MFGTKRKSAKRGRGRTRRAGNAMLRRLALPALLTGLVLSNSKKRRGNKSRRPRRGGRRTRRV